MTNHQERVPVACPVCDSDESSLFYEPWIVEDDPDRLYGAASGIPGAQRLVRCNRCSMIYENPRFSAELILRAYEQSDESGHDSQYPMRVESFANSLRSLTSMLPPSGAKVLDVGTAGGAFLEAAASQGYEAHGLEPSRFLVESGEKRGLNIRQGTIENHTFEDATFDIVCLWDVIEHLTDPKESLSKLRPLLKEDGVLIINFPDIGTTQAKLAGRRFWWILSVHLHHFTKDTIRRICAETGFRVVHTQRYWQKLQFGYLLEMAKIYKVPLSDLFLRWTPPWIKKIAIPYYASQTTTVARKTS